ncbi:MAG TPA: phosphatidate cytidylyltransferase [Flavobacteriia bacterium]|nr:phosphatidate cytidylyltransferase [Flavobacteriia bacterium]
MNNFTKRLFFGAIYVALIIIAIWFNPVIYILIFTTLMLISIYEFQKIHQLTSFIPYLFGVTIIALFYSINYRFLNPIIEFKYFIAFLFFLLFFPFIRTLFISNKKAIEILKMDFLTIVYLVIPFTIMQLIPFAIGDNKYNNQIMLGVFILIWINDTFAYLIGKQIGKNKLFQRISPKKTIEGFIGGFIFSMLGSIILAQYFTSLPFKSWIIIALITSLFGTLGDLIESMFKRNLKIKDSSNLIPGHGGFLDRLDSVIFTTPFIYIYLILLT